MKVSFVLIAVFTVFGASFGNTDGQLDLNAVPYEQRIFEDLINSTINSLIAVAARFDPIEIDHQEQNLLGHQGEVNNLHVEGFSKVVATHLKLSGLITWTLEVVTEAPKVTGSVEHWKVDGDAFYGDGAANVEINDFKVSVKAKINPLTISIKDLKVTPSIGNADVSITGLYNDEELSQQVSDYLNVFLNDTVNNDKDLHAKISEIALQIAEKILGSILG